MNDEEKLLNEVSLLFTYFIERNLSNEEMQNVLTIALSIIVLTRINLQADTNKVLHLMTNMNDTLIQTLKTYLAESN